MKSFPAYLLTAFTLAAALFAAGCHRSHSESKSDSHGQDAEHAEAAGEPREEGVTFKEGKGLSVPPETAKFIGLRVEDVTERKVTSAFQFSAQVYRAANKAQFASPRPTLSTTALASGQVSRSDASTLGAGQALTIQTADGKSLGARIAEVSSTLGTNASRVEVILAIQDDQGQLRHGVFVTATVETGIEKTVTAVPKSALLRTAEGDFVYTVSGERFVRTPVKLGVVNHEFAEITDGLFAGDQVIVQPVMSLWMAELQSIRGGKACADGH